MKFAFIVKYYEYYRTGFVKSPNQAHSTDVHGLFCFFNFTFFFAANRRAPTCEHVSPNLKYTINVQATIYGVNC